MTTAVESAPEQEVQPATSLEEPAASPLEVRWSARAAWRCLGIIVVFEVLLGMWWEIMVARVHGYNRWSHSGAGHLASALVYYIVDIAIVLYFARTQSWNSFVKSFGLASPPSSYLWFTVTATVAIRGFGELVTSSGLAQGATSFSLYGFAHTVGFQRYLYVTPALMAPFAEELYMRGFFYSAFRGSYSRFLSTGLIVGLTAVTHWNQFHRSWVASLDLSALTVLQCFLRERGNLRDCIISHFVFNASAVVLAAAPVR